MEHVALRGDRGGFAHHVRAGDWRHVYPIPDAISSSRAKEADALRFGATRLITGDEVAGEFDFILSTVSADLRWNDHLGALRPAGTLCVVGMPVDEIAISGMALLPAAKAVVGGKPRYRAVLEM